MAISRHNLVPDLPDNNFATLNPITTTRANLSHGNLRVTGGSSGQGYLIPTMIIPKTGKWYWEIRVVSVGYETQMGLWKTSYQVTDENANPMGHAGGDAAYIYYAYNGNMYHGSNESFGQSYSSGDVISHLFDADKLEYTIFKNNGNSATKIVTDAQYAPVVQWRQSTGVNDLCFNFGQDPTFSSTEAFPVTGGDNSDGSWSDANGIGHFYYQPPTGALALCSRNLQPAVSFAGYNFEETGKALTYNGDAKISKNSPYMGGSYYFSGSNSDYLQVPTNSKFSPTGDFTIEGWYYSIQKGRYFFGTGTSSGNEHLAMRVNENTTFNVYLRASGDTNNTVTSGTTNYKVNTWNHVVLERYNNEIKIYLNGKCVYTYDASSWTPHNSNTPFTIGGFGAYPAAKFNGYIADFRFVEGTAVYQGEFTPSTEPVAMTDETVIHFKSGSVTSYGNAKSVPASPFNTPSKQKENALTGFGGGSFYTEGDSGHSITVPGSKDSLVNFGDGPWTIDFWVKPQIVNGSREGLFGFANGDISDNSDCMSFYSSSQSSSPAWELTKWTANYFWPDPNISSDVWQHMTLSFEGTDSNLMRLFRNGKLLGSAIDYAPATTFNPKGDFRIGFTHDTHCPAWFADFRIRKGVAITADFDPPTEPLTVPEGEEENTLLIQPYRMKLGVGNMSMVSKNSNKPLEFSSESKPSLDSPASGIGSFEIGSSQYIEVKNSTSDSDFEFGTDALTLEAWVKKDVGSTSRSMIFNKSDRSGNNMNTAEWCWAVQADGNMIIGYPGSNLFSHSIASDIRGKWYHFVVQRDSSGKVEIFVDGQKSSSTYVWDNSLNNSHTLTIGGYIGHNESMEGHIAGARIIKGEALYTDNFNPLVGSAKAPTTGTVVLDLSSKVSLSAAENPTQHFKAVAYTGNSETTRTIDVGFPADLIWIKNRDHGNPHNLFDSVRGFGSASAGNNLQSDNNESQNKYGIYGYISSITSTEMEVSSGDNSAAYVNKDGDEMIAWCWKAGGAPADDQMMKDGEPFDIPTTGSITPDKMSVNTKAGFSIIQATFDTSTSASTIPHGLNQAPEVFFIKSLALAYNWSVYHKSIGNTHRLQLNGTGASASYSQAWNNTNPTNQVITIGQQNWHGAGNQIIYAWHSVPGYSAFGTYPGATKDAYLYTGFKPAFVIVKNMTSSTEYTSWCMFDNARMPHNPTSYAKSLFANKAAEEGKRGNGIGGNSDPVVTIDMLSSGFQIRDNVNSDEMSDSNHTYLWMAFAETPLNFANAR